MEEKLSCTKARFCFRFADYVYFETSSSSPYQIRRIEELNKVRGFAAGVVGPVINQGGHFQFGQVIAPPANARANRCCFSFADCEWKRGGEGDVLLSEEGFASVVDYARGQAPM